MDCGHVNPHERYWVHGDTKYCKHCAWSTGLFMYSDDGKSAIKGEAILFLQGDDNEIVYAWTRTGQRIFPLKAHEKKMDPEELIDTVIMPLIVSGYRCTSCCVEHTGEPAGFPLFAGAVCAPCWEDHLRQLQLEREQGKVCSMCGKPYSACYC